MKEVASFLDNQKPMEAALLLDLAAERPDVREHPELPPLMRQAAGQLARSTDTNAENRALALLRKMVELGPGGEEVVFGTRVAKLPDDPDLANLRDRPEFQQLALKQAQLGRRWDDPSLMTPYRRQIPVVERVAGLSKFWTEARLNFPYFDRTQGRDWDRIYLSYIKQVLASRSTKGYYRVLIRFAAELHDGHSNVYEPEELAPVLSSRPALRTELLEGQVAAQLTDHTIIASQWASMNYTANSRALVFIQSSEAANRIGLNQAPIRILPSPWFY